MLSAVAPNGTDTIDAFEAAGGARALHEAAGAAARSHAHGPSRGARVGENLADAAVHDDEVIRPLDRPFSPAASIVVLHGSLAPESAIVKPGVRGANRGRSSPGRRSCTKTSSRRFRGSRTATSKPGDVLVVRGMGPKGGPAMAGSASRVVFAVDAAGLSHDVAFVTDGQLSGLCNKGLTVAEVSPEAAVGGPLAMVENGDRITIDVDARTLDLDVAESDLAARRVRRGEPALKKSGGYLSIYQRSVQPMSTGAVLVSCLERVAKSDVVQAFRPARRGGPKGPHYILQCAPDLNRPTELSLDS